MSKAAYWGVGRYESTAEQLLPAARAVVQSAAIRSGEHLLDLGCGTGNAALHARLCDGLALRGALRQRCPRFILRSVAAARQVRSAPGCLGASLIAQPLRRVFYTLSAWENRESLYAFAATQPHRDIMASLRPTMRTAAFTFWDVPTGQLPLTWDDAQQRLAEQARADRASTGHTPRQT
jgi:quinol monooxygenase YgiN